MMNHLNVRHHCSCRTRTHRTLVDAVSASTHGCTSRRAPSRRSTRALIGACAHPCAHACTGAGGAHTYHCVVCTACMRTRAKVCNWRPIDLRHHIGSRMKQSRFWHNYYSPSPCTKVSPPHACVYRIPNYQTYIQNVYYYSPVYCSRSAVHCTWWPCSLARSCLHHCL
jgi:hypothetical protein